MGSRRGSGRVQGEGLRSGRGLGAQGSHKGLGRGVLGLKGNKSLKVVQGSQRGVGGLGGVFSVWHLHKQAS